LRSNKCLLIIRQKRNDLRKIKTFNEKLVNPKELNPQNLSEEKNTGSIFGTISTDFVIHLKMIKPLYLIDHPRLNL
jgi:hypothetical protein